LHEPDATPVVHLHRETTAWGRNCPPRLSGEDLDSLNAGQPLRETVPYHRGVIDDQDPARRKRNSRETST